MEMQMKTGLRPLVFLVLLTALVTNVADAQDDPIALADEGRSALKAGDNQKALELFQQVVQSLQAMLAESRAVHPGCPQGLERGRDP